MNWNTELKKEFLLSLSNSFSTGSAGVLKGDFEAKEY